MMLPATTDVILRVCAYSHPSSRIQLLRDTIRHFALSVFVLNISNIRSKLNKEVFQITLINKQYISNGCSVRSIGNTRRVETQK